MAESKAARLARIQAILGKHAVTSQAELGELLVADGISVSQGTLSKDLVELGAVRERDEAGSLIYVVPDAPQAAPSAAAKLARLCHEVLLSAVASANLVVLKTPPGAAQYFASAIDRAKPDGLLGTIAGDDTVLLVTADPAGGRQMADQFRSLSRSG